MQGRGVVCCARSRFGADVLVSAAWWCFTKRFSASPVHSQVFNVSDVSISPNPAIHGQVRCSVASS